MTLRRVDAEHGNIARVWAELGGGDWPDEEQWAALRAADVLPAGYRPGVRADAEGCAAVTTTLPMPGIGFLRLTRR